MQPPLEQKVTDKEPTTQLWKSKQRQTLTFYTKCHGIFNLPTEFCPAYIKDSLGHSSASTYCLHTTTCEGLVCPVYSQLLSYGREGAE